MADQLTLCLIVCPPACVPPSERLVRFSHSVGKRQNVHVSRLSPPVARRHRLTYTVRVPGGTRPGTLQISHLLFPFLHAPLQAFPNTNVGYYNVSKIGSQSMLNVGPPI